MVVIDLCDLNKNMDEPFHNFYKCIFLTGIVGESVSLETGFATLITKPTHRRLRGSEWMR